MDRQRPDLSRAPSSLPTDRGGVTILLSLVLVTILVVATIGLIVSSPFNTPSDSGSPTDSVDTVGAELQRAVDESQDVLNPGYSPNTTLPNTTGPSPIDYKAVERILNGQSSNFTDGQIAQVKSLMATVARQQTGTGSITTLRPTDATVTPGTLIRLGNLNTFTWNENATTIVTGVESVSDVKIILRTDTLPKTQTNATRISAGSWSMEAWQDGPNQTLNYRIDGYDGGTTHTATGTNVTFAFHNDTINGAPAVDSLEFAPGQSSFDIDIRNQLPPGSPAALPSAGGLNFVIQNGSVGSVPASQHRPIVHEAVFTLQYVDETTTYADTTTVNPDYTAFSANFSGALYPNFEVNFTKAHVNPEGARTGFPNNPVNLVWLNGVNITNTGSVAGSQPVEFWVEPVFGSGGQVDQLQHSPDLPNGITLDPGESYEIGSYNGSGLVQMRWMGPNPDNEKATLRVETPTDQESVNVSWTWTPGGGGDPCTGQGYLDISHPNYQLIGDKITLTVVHVTCNNGNETRNTLSASDYTISYDASGSEAGPGTFDSGPDWVSGDIPPTTTSDSVGYAFQVAYGNLTAISGARWFRDPGDIP